MSVPEYAGIPIDTHPIPDGGTEKQYPPQGYLLLSEAYARHHAGVWGGFKSFPPAQALRRKYRASLGSGARRAYAAQPVTAAVRHGNLRVYVVADPNLEPNIDRYKVARCFDERARHHADGCSQALDCTARYAP